MKILHRVSAFMTPGMRKELSDLNIVVQEGFSTFEIDENQESWALLSEWIKKYNAVDIVRTEFSKKELASADWFELVPSWHHGFPQPDDGHFGHLRETYDLSNYCECCGIGAIQRAPFQMKAEPKWGKNSILQLNWVFDEFFVKPEVWGVEFNKFEIPFISVRSAKSGDDLKTVVQLIASMEVDIVTDELTSEKCECCGRIKFEPKTRGGFPPILDHPSSHMVKTKQYFGSGASAHRRVLISKELFRSLMEHKIRGVSFRPVINR